MAGYWEGPIWLVAIVLGLLLLSYILVLSLSSPAASFVWSPFLGILVLGSIFLLGCLCSWTSDVCRKPDHISHLNEPFEAYEATALEDVHRQSKQGSLVVAVSRVRVQGTWKPVQGKILLSFPLLATPSVRYGDVLLVAGSPQVVSAAKNPYEFDYAAFLRLSHIYHQHFVVGEKVALLGHHPPNLVKAWSFQVLRYCQCLLSQQIHTPSARAVVSALVLGLKDDLTPLLKATYAGTGTMHVLAVSGLHVGMLYWLLNLLLSWLKSLSYTRLLSPFVSLGVLWFYAFVTGLSPSVLRSTLMFTLVVLAPILGKSRNIYNSLAASAFLLLFWNPNWLFSVSFQLSYIAVLGIVYLQPKIYAWFSFPGWGLDKLWLLASISLSAQIATAPVSIYYFHQFPSYFLFANWVVVPAALFILCLGLGVLMTSFWMSLSGLLAWILEHLVSGVNAFVGSIQTLPYSVIDHLFLTPFTVLLLYAFLASWLLFWHTRRLRYGVIACMLIGLISLRTIQACLSQQAQRRVIFYSIDRHQVVAFIRGSQSTLCVDDYFKNTPLQLHRHVMPSHTVLGISSLASYTLEEAALQDGFPLQSWQGLKVAVWGEKQFIFLDKDCRALPIFTPKVHTNFLIIENNGIKDLSPLLDQFEFDVLVLGASNTQKLAQKLQDAATQHGICSHSLHQKGALSVSF